MISCLPFGQRAPASQYFAARSLDPVHCMIVLAALADDPSSSRNAREIISAQFSGRPFVPFFGTIIPNSQVYSRGFPGDGMNEDC